MKEETRKKVASCRALQGMTVRELCETERFRENLAAYQKAQREDREAVRASYKAMRKLGGAKGYKLPSHPIDHVIMMSTEMLAKEFTAILAGKSSLPLSQRRYIEQLADQAYNLTVVQYVVEEFPELEEELLPKAKNN